MSALTSPPRHLVAPSAVRGAGIAQGDQRIVIRGIRWDLYDQLSEAIGEGQHVRLAYDGDLSDPKVDRSDIYAQHRVPEVRRFDGESLVIEHLQDDGTYIAGEASIFLPLLAKDVLRWLVEEDYSDELAWEHRLDEWAPAANSRFQIGYPPTFCLF